jgi:hypothetical protein
MSLDDLELELRKLPGVRWVAFTELGDRLRIQLHAMYDVSRDLALEASRIVARHCDVPIAVDVVRWMTRPGGDGADREHVMQRTNGVATVPTTSVTAPPPPSAQPPPPPPTPRARAPHPPAPPGHAPGTQPDILGVLTLSDTDEVEVHVGDGTTRTVGRARMSRGLLGAVDATLDAVRGGFTVEAPVEPEWARTIETATGSRPLVAVALARPGGGHCHGMWSADTEVEAAARATLDALHRNLRVARRPDASWLPRPGLLPSLAPPS